MSDSLLDSSEALKPLSFTGDSLIVLDQRLLPAEESYLECKNYKEVINAIKDMAVRGAPCIGFAGAWACCLATKESEDPNKLLVLFDSVNEARPTAVNLSKAVDRMKECLKQKGVASLVKEANAIYQEDLKMCKLMSSYGLTVLPNKSEFSIITHCNTGSLATAGEGTALGVIKLLARHKKKVRIYATETRPYLQGARLTAWELQRAEVAVSLMPDSAASFLMKTTKIDAIFVGADRVVKNGDTANKIGTYMLALAAKEHGVPFYVVAPSTSFDLSLETGDEIKIEMRAPDEVTELKGNKIAPSGIDVYNPSFDITPGKLITAFITEKGVIAVEKLASFKF
ncbi:MAG: S-methyl-5-thioribose-1-phosphate isomerase [Candidatus Caenarcaniphilales bacterium]|nr:S-methyl-5-thioribose-1-phosphate isomerase [Candidatus Caenarcaniphilales bacterium]